MTLHRSITILLLATCLVARESYADDPTASAPPRTRAALVTEISGLENAFAGLPKEAPARSALARQLAEDYVSLERIATQEKTQAEVDRDSLKTTNPAAAEQKQAVANTANTILTRARTSAEKYYSLIKTDYPNQAAPRGTDGAWIALGAA